MAILGIHGQVSFAREWPQASVVSNERIVTGAKNYLDVSEPAFWNGDRVLIVAQRGVPLVPAGEAQAPCPDAHSFYGSGPYAVGPAVAARTTAGAMYASDDGLDPFYEDDINLTASFYAFIHKDELDNITFYSDQSDAINGGGASYLPLSKVDVGALFIAPAPFGSYPSGLLAEILSLMSPYVLSGRGEEVIGDLLFSDELIGSIAAFLEESGGEESGWKKVANLTSWVFETNVDVLDQNAIGQQFGDSAKGALRGAGSFNAIVDTLDQQSFFTPAEMLKLMLITEVGSRAKARFVIAKSDLSQSACPQREEIMYETSIIISGNTLNTAVEEVISMTVQFVATGRIRIVSARS